MTFLNKIYIIHYKPLCERKRYITDFFQKNNITNYEFRSLYQREELTDEIKNKYFKLNNLNPAQICITIEHIETFREIANRCDDENGWYLILEDDAIFCENFFDKLSYHLKNIPSDAEYLDINDYFKINHNNIWVRNNVTRTTSSYLIKKKTCEKLLNTIIPFEKAIDHELNTQISIHDIKIYWISESLIHHGSGTHYPGSYTQWRG